MQSDTKNATSIFSGLKVLRGIFCAADCGDRLAATADEPIGSAEQKLLERLERFRLWLHLSNRSNRNLSNSLASNKFGQGTRQILLS